MIINGHTKILGIVGYPISHTLSPIIHHYLISKYKINLVYLPFEINPENLKFFVKGFKSINNVTGLNITVPFKTVFLQYIQKISQEAQDVGAVNTILKKDNLLWGFNTDVYGFEKSLKINFPKFQIKEKLALILGAGGSSRAIIYSLLTHKIKKIIILNRTLKKARDIKNHFSPYLQTREIKTFPLDYNFLSKNKIIPDLIVNTTSMGLNKRDPTLINLDPLKNRKTIVYDLIYNPLKTNFLKTAEKNHMQYINGLDMLVLQALKSFNIWTGINLEDTLVKDINILRAVCTREI